MTPSAQFTTANQVISWAYFFSFTQGTSYCISRSVFGSMILPTFKTLGHWWRLLYIFIEVFAILFYQTHAFPLYLYGRALPSWVTDFLDKIFFQSHMMSNRLTQYIFVLLICICGGLNKSIHLSEYIFWNINLYH